MLAARCTAVSAAAALAVLEILDDGALEQVKAKGKRIRGEIAGWNLPCVSGVRGMGLMIGVGIRGEKSHRALAAKCIENGLLVLTAGKDTIRMLPPLTISDRELEEGLAILKKTLEEA